MKTLFTIAFIALFGYAAYVHAETKQDTKDKAQCSKEGDAAVAATKLNHPLDATKVKQDAINSCMRSLAAKRAQKK